jgi:putative heme-binding domain-containing protein
VLLMRDWIAGLTPDKDVPAASLIAQKAESAALEKLVFGEADPLPALLGTSSGALSVALAILDESITGEVRQQAIAQGSVLADPMRRDLFERFLPESQRRRVLGPDIRPEALLTVRGDAARGQTLFATLCNACHRIGQVGTEFGPDLSHIAAKYQPPALLEQILAPSKIVEPAWQLATLTLTGGEVLSGFIVARSENELTLRLAGGVTQKVATKIVMKTEMARNSVMPEGMLQSLTAQEASDLLAFLAAQK